MVTFYDLPGEIRNHIYELHFENTTISILSRPNCEKMKPSEYKTSKFNRPDNRAILRVSRQVNSEAQAFRHLVTYSFNNARALMAALAEAPTASLQLVKRVAVNAQGAKLAFDNRQLSVPQVLSFSNDLKLECLSVDCYGASMQYCGHFDLLYAFFMLQRVWRTLVFRAPVSILRAMWWHANLRAGPLDPKTSAEEMFQGYLDYKFPGYEGQIRQCPRQGFAEEVDFKLGYSAVSHKPSEVEGLDWIGERDWKDMAAPKKQPILFKVDRTLEQSEVFGGQGNRPHLQLRSCAELLWPQQSTVKTPTVSDMFAAEKLWRDVRSAKLRRVRESKKRKRDNDQ